MKPEALPKRVLIIGASVRAAAESVFRFGAAPVSVDLFSDQDTNSVGKSFRVARFEQAVNLAQSIESDGWFYTGALETSPKLIREISRHHQLLGCESQVVKRIGDPTKLFVSLEHNGFDVIPWSYNDFGSDQKNWVRKPPERGAGGQNIKLLSTDNEPHERGSFLQEFFAGFPQSATFVGNRQQAVLLGITEQLIGNDHFQAPPFRYCGSINSSPMNQYQSEKLFVLGNWIAKHFSISGLFGIDFCFRGNRPYVFEVNPRWTASIEILERALSLSAFEIHANATVLNQLPTIDYPSRLSKNQTIGKAILFAKPGVSIELSPEKLIEFKLLNERNSTLPNVSDIGQPGTVINSGQPISTIFAVGHDRNSVLQNLYELASEIYSFLYR